MMLRLCLTRLVPSRGDCLYYMQQYYKWTVPWCDGIDYRDTTDGLLYLCSIRFKPIGDFDMLYLQMIDTQF
jgi:hypothetical protein